MDAARSVVASFADDTPPSPSIEVPRRLNGQAVVRFDEAVHQVSTSDVILRRRGGSRAVPASVACRDQQGLAVGRERATWRAPSC